MFSTTDYSKENLAALLYQLLRKHSSPYTDNQVANNKALRQQILKKSMDEAKSLIPGANDDEWRAASFYLGSL